MRKILSKKGSTLTNWVFVILMVSLFLVLLQTQVLDPMNVTYGKNLSTGISSDAYSNINNMNTITNRSSSDLDTAEVSRLSDGLTIVQVGSISIGVWRTLKDFVCGRFLSSILTDMLDFPPIVATVLSIIILISLVFIIIRIFMRGVTP